jgi:hypothetical protein
MPDGKCRTCHHPAPTFQDFHANSGGAFTLTVLRGVSGLIWWAGAAQRFVAALRRELAARRSPGATQ